MNSDVPPAHPAEKASDQKNLVGKISDGLPFDNKVVPSPVNDHDFVSELCYSDSYKNAQIDQI